MVKHRAHLELTQWTNLTHPTVHLSYIIVHNFGTEICTFCGKWESCKVGLFGCPSDLQWIFWLTHWGCHFAGDIFICIFLSDNLLISLNVSLRFVPEVRIYNIPSLIQIMAWRRPGDKLLSESMVASLLTHIWGTQLQWGNKTTKQYEYTLRAANI